MHPSRATKPCLHTSSPIRNGALLLLAFAALALFAATTRAEEADLIVHHAKIVTVDAGFSLRQAMAIKDGLILQTGAEEEILKLKGPRTELLDLGGGAVLPGLIDSHAHPVPASMTEFDHPLPTMESIADVLNYIAQRTQALPEGDWVEVHQVFITRLKEQRYPTRAELDAVGPRHPVLFQTGPDAALNTLALSRSGIDRNFQITDGGSGFVEKDPKTGEPTGLLRNCTRFVKTSGSARQPTARDRQQRLIELFADYNAHGLTAVCDRDASVDQIELYQSLRQANQLTVRVRVSQDIRSIGAIEEIKAAIRKVSESPLFRQRDDWLRIIGIKTFLDGGMLTGSAYMREPWGVSRIYGITDPNYRGVLFIPPDRLLAMVRAAAESGLQFTAHAVGDGAVHALLDAYAELAPQIPLRETRPCISHSNFMSREAVEKAAQLGVSVDIQPAWLYLDMATLAKQFGYDRLRYFQPLHSLFAAGVVAGGGSDHMQKIGADRAVNPYNPFLGMATAVTRKARGYDRPLHPEEALTREEAIRFYTINNARILFLDDRAGSLERGKLADFVVIDRDLLTCPAEAIAKTSVLRTYLGGKLVYARDKGNVPKAAR